MLHSATSRPQLGSDCATVSSSLPSSYSPRRRERDHSQQVLAYLEETDSYRALLCQGPQGNRTGHTALHNGSSYAHQDQPENLHCDSRALALAQYGTLDESLIAPWYGRSAPDHKPLRSDDWNSGEASPQYNVPGHPHHRPTRCDGWNSSEASPQYNVRGHPHHRPTRCDGWNSSEASPQYNVPGHPHHRPSRHGGHNSAQASTHYDVHGAPAQSQTPARYGNVCPPHMVATSRHNPMAMIEDGILDGSQGPPPYEVAARSQAMAQHVHDWSVNWDRMERGSSNDSGDGRGE